ncbi:hypothetical protein L1049_007797 [Liquidambar formosana]|uniref:Uncharacterized protein n=1 Tax=Liquidambar formosana TaxID=63359 RepID=A0AAP0S9Q8_LIQFO
MQQFAMYLDCGRKMAEGETSFQDLEAQNWMDPIIEKFRVLKERPLKTSIFKLPYFIFQQYVRGRYAKDIILDPHQLAEIMLVDGCFILELFLRSWLRDFTEEDPIFHNAWMVPTIRHDLALLENQIPFFILEELFDKIIEPLIPKSEHQLITGLALSFFNPDLKLNEESIPKKYSQDGEHLHLLDLLHKFHLPTYHKIDPEGEKYIHPLESLHLSLTSNTAQCTEELLPQSKESWGFKKSATTLLPQSNESWGFKRSATKLLEAGIELERGRDDHLLEISFNKAKGDIIIPPMRIDETTKSLLRNLIAYEQCRSSAQQHITSYAILLGTLIHSAPDVELLQ